MKAILFTQLFCALTATCLGQTVYFQQDFSAGGTPGTYVNAAPNANQFTGISGLSAAIVNNRLQFDRSSATGTAHFSRSANFSPVPKSLYIQLDFEVVSTTATAANSALVFYVGANFGNSTNNPVVADTYARFGISLVNTGGQFAVRHIESVNANSINSQTFMGRQTITFVVNNSGTNLTYLQPGGGFQSLPDDTYDLWVGNTQVFNNFAVVTPGQTLSDFKLRVDSGLGAAVFQFDNIQMRDISGQLPLSEAYLSAQVTGPTVQLRWTLPAQQPGTVFSVERSPDALMFVPMGTLTASADRLFSFTDPTPLPGWAYYRLAQTSPDGLRTLSNVVAVEMPDPGDVPALTILNNPVAGTNIICRTSQLAGATFRLTTLSGMPVPTEQQQTPGNLTLRAQQPISPGVYLLTAFFETFRLTRRVLFR